MLIFSSTLPINVLPYSPVQPKQNPTSAQPKNALPFSVVFVSTMPRPRSYSATSSTSTFSVNTLSSLPSSDPPRPPSSHNAPHQHQHHGHHHGGRQEQEMALGSMYDYLVKFILIGPSGCGKSLQFVC